MLGARPMLAVSARAGGVPLVKIDGDLQSDHTTSSGRIAAANRWRANVRQVSKSLTGPPAAPASISVAHRLLKQVGLLRHCSREDVPQAHTADVSLRRIVGGDDKVPRFAQRHT